MLLLHESDIEKMLIDLLKAKKYNYHYGPDIAPDGETPMRASFEDVVLRDKLEKAVKRLNPSLPYSVQDEAVKTVLRISSPDVLANNEEFHRLLTCKKRSISTHPKRGYSFTFSDSLILKALQK